MRGKAAVIRRIADELISAKGVKHGKLTVTTTRKDLTHELPEWSGSPLAGHQRPVRPCLHHDSYVRYASAKEVKMADFDRWVEAGLFEPRRAASAAFLQKLIAGAMASALLPTELRALGVIW